MPKRFAFARNIPLVAVNHVEGHIHSVLLENPAVPFPALALVVSGGHTHMFEVTAMGQYRLLGRRATMRPARPMTKSPSCWASAIQADR